MSRSEKHLFEKATVAEKTMFWEESFNYFEIVMIFCWKFYIEVVRVILQRHERVQEKSLCVEFWNRQSVRNFTIPNMFSKCSRSHVVQWMRVSLLDKTVNAILRLHSFTLPSQVKMLPLAISTGKLRYKQGFTIFHSTQASWQRIAKQHDESTSKFCWFFST